jgi:ATP-dependent Clp protease adaptor protein ClpS
MTVAKNTLLPALEEQLKVKTKVVPPKKYIVLLLNDDFTPMDFVVNVIVSFFGYPMLQATQIMEEVHEKGKAKVGVFDKSIAETLCFQVNECAKESGHPLKCIFEKE